MSFDAATLHGKWDSVYAPAHIPGTGGCTEYMVYHKDQMIPVFLIEFKRWTMKKTRSLAGIPTALQPGVPGAVPAPARVVKRNVTITKINPTVELVRLRKERDDLQEK